MTRECLHCALNDTIRAHADEHNSGVGDVQQVLLAVIEVIVDIMITAPDQQSMAGVIADINYELPRLLGQKLRALQGGELNSRAKGNA